MERGEEEENSVNQKKSRYDQEYMRQNITRKLIPFNKLKQDDMEILEWLNSRPEGATAYIKDLIRRDMRS
jgi:hypothetical protein